MDHYDKAARHLVAWLRDVLPARTDRLTVERYRDDRLREGASARLVVQEFKVLRMAWKWGQECGLVPDRALPRAKVQVDRTHFVANHRTPTEDEVARVLEHLQGDYRLAVELMATTGARVGEVCSLRGRDFDPATGDLTLRGKTGARAYPLPQHVAEKLRGRARGDVPLLQLAKRAPTECVRSHLTRACRAASVERFTPPTASVGWSSTSWRSEA